MRFSEAPIAGVWIIEPERSVNERGFFARTFCAREFVERGLETVFEQCSISFSQRRGTLRGLHWQAAPHGEHKLIRCTMGVVHDVVVDIRRTLRRSSGGSRSSSPPRIASSSTSHAASPMAFRRWRMTASFHYQISESYRTELARGARWDDPVFGIEWPMPPSVISERDRGYPDFRGGQP